MFNEYQLQYMEDLAKIPLEEKCYCGCFRLGKCLNNCLKGKTCADKLRDRKVECGDK